jgi:signal-transduction protein with cAMP-binding, CBS, and nucleotidyltransferase domain
MKKLVSALNEKQIEELKESHEILSISDDFDIVYEKQIPNTGIALIQGEIELTKRSKFFERINSGSLFGIYQLIHQEPIKVGCKVKKDSKIILLGRSEILESLKDSKSKLFQLIKEYRKNEKS